MVDYDSTELKIKAEKNAQHLFYDPKTTQFNVGYRYNDLYGDFFQRITKKVLNTFQTKYTYAICVSPRETTDDSVIQEILINLKDALLIFDKAQWMLIPEFTDEGRLHFHGWFRCPYSDMNDYLIKQATKQMAKFARIEMKLIRNRHKYYEYVFKNFKKTFDIVPMLACMSIQDNVKIPQKWFPEKVLPESKPPKDPEPPMPSKMSDRITSAEKAMRDSWKAKLEQSML
ncbi:MAG: putative replicase [Cressdnaviricota sp.]|nr:MAG: putative replicase [Cressdnaviricota sp.]